MKARAEEDVETVVVVAVMARDVEVKKAGTAKDAEAAATDVAAIVEAASLNKKSTRMALRP